ncbi:DUF177 domain-containing protein [Candidatus Latescibacterota bacterium]
MKINFSGTQNKTSVFEFDTDAAELNIQAEDITFVDGIHVVCEMHKYIDLSKLDIEIKAHAEQNCSLCVEPFRFEINGELSLVVRHMKKGELFPSFTEDDSGDIEAYDDNLIFLPYGEDSIDITENVHDALLLAVPTKPLCKDDCKGLCTECGENLNISDCGCSTDKTDSRWQELSKLADKSSKNKKNK